MDDPGQRGLQPYDLFSSGYKPELDGLRAVAVSFVALDHYLPMIFPGGFVGVDLFFVLSGFLITSLLANELGDTGGVNLKAFYWKRALRLTPALFAMLSLYLCGIIVYVAWSHKFQFAETHLWAISAAATYLMNWNLALGIGTGGFIEHTWTLGIEEQFYLIWPLLLIFLWRRLTRIELGIFCFLLILLSSGWRMYLWYHHLGTVPASQSAMRIYMGFDTRADSLLVGCFLALFPLKETLRERIASSVGLPIVSIVISLFLMTWDGAPYQLGSCLVAVCAGWIVVAVLTNRQSLVARGLRLRPMIYFGRISYGFYLWHEPIWFALGWFVPNLEFTQAALAMTLSFAASASSYHLMEVPLRRYRPIVSSKPLEA